MSQSKEYKPTHGGYPGVVPASIAGLVNTAPAFPVRANLLAALALIDTPEKWTVGSRGLLHYEGCYCMLGAIAKQKGITYDSEPEGIYAVLRKTEEVQELATALRREAPGLLYRASALPDYVVYVANDDTAQYERWEVRHERVIALFKRAIARVNA